MNDLFRLPALYADCDRGTASKAVRAISRAPRKNTTVEPMNAAATEIRFSIRTVLASWSGLVAEERRLGAPARDIPALARFLGRNADWLIRHPAVGDLADEIHELARTAQGVAYPDSLRRVPVGDCPGDGDGGGGCDGDLVAVIRPSGDSVPSRIVCTTSPGHSWPVTWWNRLARQMGPRPQGGAV